MSKIEYKKIGLNKLHINLENPRFEAVSTEKEALELMIADQPTKLIKLAKDILESNLNPSDFVQIAPSTLHSGKYVVLEGNRRISILKILKNPRQISSSHASFIKRLNPFIVQFQANPINTVYCVVYSDPNAADKWIELKHTGENDGVGTVPWDTTQQARFNKKIRGHNPIALQAIEFLTRSTFTDAKLQKDLQKLPYTNIERLLTDPDVRDVLGISYKNKMLETTLEESEIVKGLTKIAKDFLYNDYTVNHVRTKKDRAKYLEEFTSDDLPSRSTSHGKSWRLLSTPNTSNEENNRPPDNPEKGKVNSVPKTRKTLIPKSFIVKISDPRPNKIYHELKNINVSDFENATAVTFRVFVELSIDAFIDSKNGRIKGVKKMTPFKDKVQKTIDYFEAANMLNDHQLKGIRVLINEPHGLLSIDTFNAYVHNRTYSPKESHLMATWDDIQLFIEKLWQNID